MKSFHQTAIHSGFEQSRNKLTIIWLTATPLFQPDIWQRRESLLKRDGFFLGAGQIKSPAEQPCQAGVHTKSDRTTTLACGKGCITEKM